MTEATKAQRDREALNRAMQHHCTFAEAIEPFIGATRRDLLVRINALADLPSLRSKRQMRRAISALPLDHPNLPRIFTLLVYGGRL